MKQVYSTIAAISLIAMIAVGCSKAPGQQQPVKLDPQTAVQRRQEGADLIQKGDMKQAEQVLTQVKDSIPNDAESHFLLGVTYYNKKDYAGAAKEYQEAIRLDPKHYEAYNGLGNVYRDQKNFDEAEKDYRKVIELRPQFSFGYTNLALMLADRDPNKGIDVLLAGVKAIPGDLDMRFTLATLYTQAGRKDDAKNTLEQILKDSPGYKPAADALEKLK